MCRTIHRKLYERWRYHRALVMRVQVVEGEYRLVLPPDMVEELKLKDGDALQVQAVTPATSTGEHRAVTLEEGMAAFRRVEQLHRNTLREVAK